MGYHESVPEELGASNVELQRARVKNAQRALEQAEQELAAADETQKSVWEERVKTRGENLKTEEAQLNELTGQQG